MNSWIGLFWLPSESTCDRNTVDGVLKHSPEGTYLELSSERLPREFALIPSSKEKWRRRVVGKLADGLFVSMKGCTYTGTTHYAMRTESRITFLVRGTVYLSSEEEIVSPHEATAHEVHVEIGGLPEWFASALSHRHPSFPHATGLPLTRDNWVEARCNDNYFEVDLDEVFKLHIQNTLYWWSDGLFGLTVRQATVARIRATSPVGIDLMLEKVRPLVEMVRFLSGENCVLRSAYLFRTDSTLSREHGGGPIGMRLLIGHQGHQFMGWGDMLFQWKDIVGHEDILIPKWYRLYAEKRYALRVLDRVVSQSESEECGIVLMVGSIQNLTSSSKRKSRYEDFLADLGLETWGIDVATLGKKIAYLRNWPAHGRPFPLEEDIPRIYQLVLSAMRVYFLREMGFSKEQVFRIAKRHSGLRRGLGLPAKNLDAHAQNEMLRTGWIMEGAAI